MKRTTLIKALSIALSILLAAGLMGCAGMDNNNANDKDNGNGGSAEQTGTELTPASDSSIDAAEATGEFVMTTEDGEFTRSGSVYTVTTAGTYSLTGAINGQIIVEAGSDDKVILELNGVTIKNSYDSPVKILSADKTEISAKKGTDNVIKDERAAKTADDETQGEGAIYAKTDLKLKGSGTLVIEAGYNNGVHTTKDLTVQKLELKVTAYNNALKGSDSVTIKSGTVVAISTNGDGIKTTATDADKSGETRGDIDILSGSISVYAAGDGIQAAHDFNLTADEDGNYASVFICTGAYSDYTAESADTTSYKGVKVQNELNISAGSITLNCYDDGLHADSGETFEAGGTGLGNINICGGTVTAVVYSPEGATMGGRMGPGGMSGGHGGFGGGFPDGQQGGGWEGQQTVSGADGIHAEGELNISGGNIEIDSAYEGLEANVINISGGSTAVAAIDDGVNACKGASTPMVNVTGGYLEVSVSPNGDHDGIDSNGGYSQTGGVVITRGPSMEMAAALDAESGARITGGTLIALGYARVTTGGNVKSASLSLHSAGSHTVTINGESYTFENASVYGSTSCWSDTEASGS